MSGQGAPPTPAAGAGGVAAAAGVAPGSDGLASSSAAGVGPGVPGTGAGGPSGTSGSAVGSRAPAERLEARLAEAREQGRAVLVAFGVAGYPDRERSLAAFRAMAAAGADVLEVGPPYSDPLIDGPVIQRADRVALDGGVRLDDVLAMVAELTADPGVPPVLLLLYYNLIAHRGPERFARDLAATGACGAVVPDLPPEEAGEWLAAASRVGIAPVFLAAPTSTKARLGAVARVGRGFVYAQATMGVTGLRATLAEGVEELVGRVRAHIDLPVCVGIGVSSPEQAATVARFADGVIVGSALVRRLGEDGVEGVRALTAELAAAIRAARPGRP
ncbi:MAG TPA: tryptophan synthase subunit alpha [Actinomycetes bacterium]|nr:tryptophan synthase subunit alpha [Actinomycetes bacterium]